MCVMCVMCALLDLARWDTELLGGTPDRGRREERRGMCRMCRGGERGATSTCMYQVAPHIFIEIMHLCNICCIPRSPLLGLHILVQMRVCAGTTGGGREGHTNEGKGMGE